MDVDNPFEPLNYRWLAGEACGFSAVADVAESLLGLTLTLLLRQMLLPSLLLLPMLLLLLLLQLLLLLRCLTLRQEWSRLLVSLSAPS